MTVTHPLPESDDIHPESAHRHSHATWASAAQGNTCKGGSPSLALAELMLPDRMGLPELWTWLGPGLAGAVFGGGWWFWVDAVVCSDIRVPFLHYLPGPPSPLLLRISSGFSSSTFPLPFSCAPVNICVLRAIWRIFALRVLFVHNLDGSDMVIWSLGLEYRLGMDPLFVWRPVVVMNFSMILSDWILWSERC